MAFFIASYHQLVSKTTGGPEGPFGRVFSNTSYQQLLWTPTHQDPKGPFGLVWISLPHLVSTPTVWLLVLTELYNSSTPTQSPSQSLEWHVWSSSSGNKCHAVQRSLSSCASVYECIMGFFPCPILLARSTYAIFSHRCNRNVSLPSGASLWMAYLPGPMVKILQYQSIGLVGWVFANGPRLVYNPRSIHNQGTWLLYTQCYKKRIKGKVEQLGERSSALLLHLGVVVIEK